MREITKDSSLGVGDPLVSLGPLCQGRILRRPSQHIKSPYVADVELDPQFGAGEVTQMLIFVTFAFNTITFNHFHFLKLSSRWQTLTGFFGWLNTRILESSLSLLQLQWNFHSLQGDCSCSNVGPWRADQAWNNCSDDWVKAWWKNFPCCSTGQVGQVGSQIILRSLAIDFKKGIIDKNM